MTTQDTAINVEIRDNAYETRESTSFGGIHIFGWDETTPVFGWEWPDEARLADFAGKNDRVEQAEQPPEDDPEYATLYFVA